eukprot:144783_1
MSFNKPIEIEETTFEKVMPHTKLPYEPITIVKNGKKTTVHPTVEKYFFKEKELQFAHWFKTHPTHYDEEHRYLFNNPISISSWEEYAAQITYGRVRSHFDNSTICKNHAISENCVHNMFKNISEC